MVEKRENRMQASLNLTLQHLSLSPLNIVQNKHLKVSKIKSKKLKGRLKQISFQLDQDGETSMDTHENEKQENSLESVCLLKGKTLKAPPSTNIFQKHPILICNNYTKNSLFALTD